MLAKRQSLKRVLASVLSVIMLLGLMPTAALAAGEGTVDLAGGAVESKSPYDLGNTPGIDGQKDDIYVKEYHLMTRESFQNYCWEQAGNEVPAGDWVTSLVLNGMRIVAKDGAETARQADITGGDGYNVYGNVEWSGLTRYIQPDEVAEIVLYGTYVDNYMKEGWLFDYPWFDIKSFEYHIPADQFVFDAYDDNWNCQEFCEVWFKDEAPEPPEQKVFSAEVSFTYGYEGEEAKAVPAEKMPEIPLNDKGVYLISLLEDKLEGWTQDGEKYTKDFGAAIPDTITVDDVTYTLTTQDKTIAISEQGEHKTFHYTKSVPTQASVDLEIQKAVKASQQGSGAPAEIFRFFLVDTTNGINRPVETKSMVTTGVGSYTEHINLTYTAAGEYTYELCELPDGAKDWTYDVNAIYRFQVVVTEQNGKLTAELKDQSGNAIDGKFAFTNTYNGFYQPDEERLVVLQGGVRQADGSLKQLYLESYRVSVNEPYDMTDELAALEKEHCTGYNRKEVFGNLKGEAGNSDVKILVEYAKPVSGQANVDLEIQKAVKASQQGSNAPAETFRFFLVDTTNGVNQPVETKSMVTTGVGSYAEHINLTYTTTGVHTYELCELPGKAEDWDYDLNAIYRFQVVVTADNEGKLTAELKDQNGNAIDGKFAFTNTYNGFYQPAGERLVVLQGGVRQADGSLKQLYLESYHVSVNEP